MIVKMFQQRFARFVEGGVKTQTIRPTPKRLPQVGDKISCREWTGKAYRSKQRVLCESTIERVAEVTIGKYGYGVVVGGEHLDSKEADLFAFLDGFDCMDEMAKWFNETHGLPFTGILIEWKKPNSET